MAQKECPRIAIRRVCDVSVCFSFMSEKKLNSIIQKFIIQRLASFERPQEVADSVKDIFGVSVSLKAITYYHIDNAKLSTEWRELFLSLRRQFISRLADIPIFHKAYRLKQLQRLYDRQASSKIPNEVEMLKILEQAAKEVGGMYENRRRIEYVPPVSRTGENSQIQQFDGVN